MAYNPGCAAIRRASLSQPGNPFPTCSCAAKTAKAHRRVQQTRIGYAQIKYRHIRRVSGKLEL
ncbi:hypothetical protein ACFGVS_01000 [Mucilaginibacter sp. AW1-7]|uniref:hypothetical protein n=1 Tax=Mucilaginibacter sp. AW1-7 TaxID=3349874 RepID=UPI003F73F9CD